MGIRDNVLETVVEVNNDVFQYWGIKRSSRTRSQTFRDSGIGLTVVARR